jgi:hypothetical protein
MFLRMVLWWLSTLCEEVTKAQRSVAELREHQGLVEKGWAAGPQNMQGAGSLKVHPGAHQRTTKMGSEKLIDWFRLVRFSVAG